MIQISKSLTNELIFLEIVGPKKKTWVPWTKEEKACLKVCFQQQIVRGILLRKEECERAIRKNPVLQSRDWKKVKDMVRNMSEAHKRSLLLEG